MRDQSQIIGVSELIRAGAFVMSELLRVMNEEGGEMRDRYLASLARGEQPMLTVRGLADDTGTVIELVTQRQEGEADSMSYTTHAQVPILKAIPGSAIN